MASVFLSYDHDDIDRAASLAAALEAHGHAVWWDRHIHGGAEYNSEIESAVERSDAVVVLWSAKSVRSAWVRDEAAEGRDAGKLVPVLIDGVKPPMGFRQHQTIDLACWSGGKRVPRLPELLHAIDRFAKTTPAVDMLSAEPQSRPKPPTVSALPSPRMSRRMMLGGGVAAVGGAAGLWWIARDRADPRVARLLNDGKRILREGWPDSEAQGVDLFRQAVRLDPRNDEAWGLLALALRNVIEHAPPSQTTAAVLECESAARRALAINPREGNALTALAMMRPEFGNWFEAETSLGQVLRVAPDNLAAMAHLALLFQSVGRTRDSGVLNDRLVALDPLSPVYQFRRAMRLWVQGRVAEADQTIDRALQLWPRHPAVWSARITIFAFTGRTGAAERLLDDVRMRPSTYTSASGELYRVSLRALGSGSPADVAAAVKANVKAAPQSGGSATRAVMVLSALGQLDAAFDVAEGFLLRRGPLIGTLWAAKNEMPISDAHWRRTMNLFTPATAAMRADPRFEGLCNGIGMTAYWRKRGIWPDPMFRLSFQPA